MVAIRDKSRALLSAPDSVLQIIDKFVNHQTIKNFHRENYPI